MRITRSAFLVVPLLLLACEREPVAPEVEVAPQFAATSEWIEASQYMPEGDPFYVPCIDDDVDEIGWLYGKLHLVTKDGVEKLYRWKIWWDSDYIIRGEKTGDWYAVPGSHNKIMTTSNVGEHHSHNLRWVFRNATTGMVLDWPERWTFIMNANGEWKVERYMDPCRVRHD